MHTHSFPARVIGSATQVLFHMLNNFTAFLKKWLFMFELSSFCVLVYRVLRLEFHWLTILTDSSVVHSVSLIRSRLCFSAVAC